MLWIGEEALGRRGGMTLQLRNWQRRGSSRHGLGVDVQAMMTPTMQPDDDHSPRDDRQHQDRDGTVHLHRLALTDDWQRQRLLLSAFVVSMDDDFPSVLSRELAMSALLQAAMMCGDEVSAHDDW